MHRYNFAFRNRRVMLQNEKKTRRREMLAAVIQEELSDIILESVKDPACAGTVIISVKMNADLSLATVSILSRNGKEDTTERAVVALNHAAAFIRGKLRGRLDVKRIPDLRFVGDTGIIDSVRMAQILDALKQERLIMPSAGNSEEGEKEAPAV